MAVALIICFISAATQTYDIPIAGTQGNCSDKALTENDLKSSSSTNSINLTIYEINGYVCRSTKCCLNIHPFTHFLEILTWSFNQIECKWPKTMFSSSNEGFAFCTKTACCEYHVRSKKRPAVLGPGPGPADNNYCRRWTRALEDILIDLNHQTFISLDMIDNVSEVCLKECKCFQSFDNFSSQIHALSYTQF